MLKKAAGGAISFIDRLEDAAALILFLFLFLLGLYCVYDSFYVYSGASMKGTLVYKPGGEESKDLGTLSKDCVGWIEIDDTSIDYPLMHGANNSVYLNRDPFGNYSLSGSIFLDARNSGDLKDPYLLIYGHHMDLDKMFGALDYFISQAFLKSHRTGRLTAVDGTVYELNIWAAGYCEASDSEIFDPTSGADIEAFAESQGFAILDHGDGRIAALTTCKEPSSLERTIVLCEILE